MKFLLNPLNLLRTAAAAVVLAALLAAGCGGGVGSGGTGSFASGPITGFGSVIVNNVRFDDGAAAVEDGDGERRSNSDLRLGMTVEIDSSAFMTDATGVSASASRIRFDSELRGPVASVDVAGNAFSLLGQRVTVDSTTVFAEAPGALVSMAPGALVEVFAVFDPAAARYRAKRVAMAAAGATAQLRGPVAQLDVATQTLRLGSGSGSATYSYAGATGVPATLAVGQFVRLRVATSVLPSGRWQVLSFGTALQPLVDADGASLKGLITAFTSATSFSVNGRPVDATNASFPDGRAGLALGVRVETEGSLRNGTLRATKVSIESDAQESEHDFELHGAVESVNAAAKTFGLRGQTVSTARSDLRYENGNATNLVVGRRVEVKGRLSSDGLRIEATKISFE
jgi:hypothetical protein